MILNMNLYYEPKTTLGLSSYASFCPLCSHISILVKPSISWHVFISQTMLSTRKWCSIPSQTKCHLVFLKAKLVFMLCWYCWICVTTTIHQKQMVMWKLWYVLWYVGSVGVLRFTLDFWSHLCFCCIQYSTSQCIRSSWKLFISCRVLLVKWNVAPGIVNTQCCWFSRTKWTSWITHTVNFYHQTYICCINIPPYRFFFFLL